nr:Uveal autoantigen with coiled-coil domains and ankyrin repeats isoform 1 [Ipomoea batatas]
MVYSYTPTYYSTLHDSITSLCKNMLPFSFKKRRVPAIAAAEQRLSKQQTDNLKWQQESFHQILNLMGLCKEGILGESEVSAFRSHLLETLIAAPVDHEHPSILRDKLIFLQDLLYAKCISEEEYHSSKRPLLQRLAVQGGEIEARNVIVGSKKEISDEEWSVIDLKDDKEESTNSKPKSKQNAAMKQIKGAASALGFARSEKIKEENQKPFNPSQSTENPFWSESKSILMAESSGPEPSVKVEKQSGGEKPKRKPFRSLFQTEPSEEKEKSGKKQWGFDGFKKWKKSESDDETAPLSLAEKSDGKEAYPDQLLVTEPIGEGPDTKQIKKKLLPNGAPSDFFVDKVLGENIKKELLQIQTKLDEKNSSVQFTDDQIEAISTRLPVDKADLKKFFPKQWCDRYGDVVLDVVRKEFKQHVAEMGNSRGAKKWETFDEEEDDDENCHPNLFAHSKQGKYGMQTSTTTTSIDKGFKYNPFFDV